MVAVLQELGFRARLEVVGGSPYVYFATVGDSRRRAQIGFSGWLSDYPVARGLPPTTLRLRELHTVERESEYKLRRALQQGRGAAVEDRRHARD